MLFNHIHTKISVCLKELSCHHKSCGGSHFLLFQHNLCNLEISSYPRDKLQKQNLNSAIYVPQSLIIPLSLKVKKRNKLFASGCAAEVHRTFDLLGVPKSKPADVGLGMSFFCIISHTFFWYQSDIIQKGIMSKLLWQKS